MRKSKQFGTSFLNEVQTTADNEVSHHDWLPEYRDQDSKMGVVRFP
jgi:hypothetical protein